MPDPAFAGPWCDDTRGLTPKVFGAGAGCPSSVLSCTAWGFSCLANYFASGELLPRLFTLACAFSKNRRCLFCDTLRQSQLWSGLPAYFTRHAAVWCSDFPPVTQKRVTSDHLPSAHSLTQLLLKRREPRINTMDTNEERGIRVCFVSIRGEKSDSAST
jgi:hypothetical protein